MKIAIITPNGQFNYGNRLQNYALTELLRRNGAQAETLVLEEQGGKAAMKWALQRTNLWPLITQKNVSTKISWQRFKRFKAFTEQYIPTRYYGPIGLRRLSRIYDYFFIGSDQIWNPYHHLARDCDFATFAAQEQRVAVAASFGVTELPPEQESRIAERLREIPHLSVREVSGAELVQRLTGKTPQVLIDPALMLEQAEWAAISQKPRQVAAGEVYILSYFLGKKSSEVQTLITQWAKEAGGREYPLLDVSRPELYVSGPAEFLWLIKHAALVCTDSFHAVAFSILFNRPFWVFSRDGDGAGMGDRISTLLHTMKLEDRLLSHHRKKPQDAFAYSYTESHRILEQERTKFLIYLRSAVPSMNL